MAWNKTGKYVKYFENWFIGIAFFCCANWSSFWAGLFFNFSKFKVRLLNCCVVFSTEKIVPCFISTVAKILTHFPIFFDSRCFTY